MGYYMDKSEVRYWQLVWFFSMDKTAQASLIGPTDDQWFIEENDTNCGANYLIGLCLALSEGFRPDSSHADDLWRAVCEASAHLEPDYWIFGRLSDSPEWTRARKSATELLRSENPRVTPPRKPFVVEDMIRVDHYLHATKIRGRKRWRKASVSEHRECE